MLRTALLTLALLAPAAAQDVTYERFQLENGLTVILHEDHSLPQVVINVWYHVGSKDEPEGRSGFAHLFEHLMFRGTERVPDGRFDELMEVGGGYNNASTTTDRTNYDPRVHGTPGWNTNIPTDELVNAPERPDCPSDFNNDDVSDVLDLLAFLVEWFAENETADFNNDGITDVLDLLDFLSVWFPGCDTP